MTLPLSADISPAIESDASSTFNAGNVRRVLIVDDNRDAAESLGMLLQLDGRLTRIAVNGADAVQLFEAFRPEVVFLDIGLPDLDGYEVARRMRATAWGKNARIVALTGWGQADDKRRASEAGFDHHLTKPVDPALLCAVLGAP